MNRKTKSLSSLFRKGNKSIIYQKILGIIFLISIISTLNLLYINL